MFVDGYNTFGDNGVVAWAAWSVGAFVVAVVCQTDVSITVSVDLSISTK